jgi:hypothetical protein
MTPEEEPQPVEDRTLKLIGYGLLQVVGTTVVFAANYQKPLDGFLIGLAIFIFIWKIGLIDVIKVWWP